MALVNIALRVLTILLLLIGFMPIAISAQEDCSEAKLRDLGVAIINCETDEVLECGVNSNGITIRGSDNQERSYNFFIDQGLEPIHAAGIVGNLMVESGDAIDPEAVNPSSGATGIAQWLGSRLVNMRAWITEQGGDVNSFEDQLQFLWYEVTEGTESTGGFFPLERLRETTNVRDAAISWEVNFERSGGALLERRVSHAQSVLARYGSGSTSSSSGTVQACSGGSSGEVIGDFSLPLDRELFEQNPDFMTAPHHDYPASDMGIVTGTPVYSMTDGEIISAPTGGACGVGVVVDAGNGAVYTYCHGSDGGSVPGARQGDTVSAGQLIMHSANTGRSTGPHLHLGIRLNGEQLCPQTLLEGIFNEDIPPVSSLPTSGCTY